MLSCTENYFEHDNPPKLIMNGTLSHYISPTCDIPYSW